MFLLTVLQCAGEMAPEIYLRNNSWEFQSRTGACKALKGNSTQRMGSCWTTTSFQDLALRFLLWVLWPPHRSTLPFPSQPSWSSQAPVLLPYLLGPGSHAQHHAACHRQLLALPQRARSGSTRRLGVIGSRSHWHKGSFLLTQVEGRSRRCTRPAPPSEAGWGSGVLANSQALQWVSPYGVA